MKVRMIKFNEELDKKVQKFADSEYDGNFSLAVRKVLENKLKNKK